MLDLLPVLDSVEAAREHDELVGGFKLVADELEKITAQVRSGDASARSVRSSTRRSTRR